MDWSIQVWYIFTLAIFDHYYIILLYNCYDYYYYCSKKQWVSYLFNMLLWIVEIDCHQRVCLAKDSGDLLKVKVPYEQIKPHISSGLHKPVPSPSAEQVATPSADTQSTPSDQQKPALSARQDQFLPKRQNKYYQASHNEYSQPSHNLRL